MSLPGAAVRLLERIDPNAMRLGLEAPRRLLRRLGDPQDGFATVLVACLGSSKPIHQQVEIGQTKQEIIDAVGEPDTKENIIKNVEHIFGPEEEFWYDIPMGAKLERWGYDDEGGHLNYILSMAVTA